MSIYQYKVDQHLEQKSKLVFQFNTDTDPGGIHKVLEFMENITIDESVSTNYAQYTPIGSNGSVFAYLGSKSREFSLSFNITLPHIMENTLIKPPPTKTLSKTALMGSFFKNGAGTLNAFTDKSKKYSKFIRDVDLQHKGLLTDADKELGAIKATPWFLKDTPRETALIKVMFWVNLIRASCITNASKPFLGPPIVRLYHGILYNDIPCIVKDYNLSYDHLHGFDNSTMLPRVLSVKLNLQEVRLRGKSFSHGADGDYMPGWDSMFVEDDFVTLDPNVPGWSN